MIVTRTASRPRIARALAVGAVALAVAAPACSRPAPPPVPPAPVAPPVGPVPAPATVGTAAAPPDDIGYALRPELDAPIAGLVDAAIAEPRLPGAVVRIGHAGKVVFNRAFGVRRLADEPALDGSAAPAEPMTVETVFDIASLTKSLATSTAVLQLYEQGRIALDEPVQSYLPEFNPDGDARRARVTLRMLLTHTSGIGGDLSHQGPWGLTAPDKADGIARALSAPLEFDPATVFHYSDIGFIILGALVERLTDRPLDEYAQDNVFAPLGMADTRYLPIAKACGPHEIRGDAIVVTAGAMPVDCPAGTWRTDLIGRIAPTAHDEDTPGINPDFDRLLRGTVHDPTARRMGGVAGSAGVFTTARDIGRYAQALLDRLAGRPSPFPLQRETLELMTSPQQPGHEPGQLAAANAAARAAGPNPGDPLLAPHCPAVPGQNLRGLGWDIDTGHSRPRGVVFPIGSFGHGGFTGVTLWIDPGSDSYVIVLANVIHQRGGPPITKLAGDIATVAGRGLHLYGS